MKTFHWKVDKISMQFEEFKRLALESYRSILLDRGIRIENSD